MSNSLKSVFTDIADATKEIFNKASDNWFYGPTTLPNIVDQLNNIDNSYNITLPANYDKIGNVV